jgi:cysteine-S-conjugate beta-lyase
MSRLFKSPDRRKSDSIKWKYFPDDVLPMWEADMDFTSPPEVISTLHDRVEHGVFGYGDNSKILAELVVERMERLYQWKIDIADVLLLPGVITGFNLACQALTTPGESLVIQPPIYPPFFSVSANSKVNEIQCPLENDGDGNYEINFSSLEKDLEKSKFLLFCNPHNPIGKVYMRAELEKVAEACLRNDVFICSDEIHSDLIFEGNRHIPIASLSADIGQKSITLIAPSKTFNIAGLDCAILICQNKELMKSVKRERKGVVGGVNLLGSAAAIAAYKYGQPWLEEILQYLQGNRDYLCQYIGDNLPGINVRPPDATYLAWLNCAVLDLPQEPFDFFLQNARVGLNRGSEFGRDGKPFVRLNFGCTRETLAEALERMRKSLS